MGNSIKCKNYLASHFWRATEELFLLFLFFYQSVIYAQKCRTTSEKKSVLEVCNQWQPYMRNYYTSSQNWLVVARKDNKIIHFLTPTIEKLDMKNCMSTNYHRLWY